MKGRRTQQPEGRAGDDILLRPVCERLAVLCSAQEIAQLCATSSRLRRAVPGKVRLAMQARHGLVIPGGGTRYLFTLDGAPTAWSLDFRQKGAVRVEQGSAFRTTMVGYEDLSTRAQDPRCGDAWSADVALQRGFYSLGVLGSWAGSTPRTACWTSSWMVSQ